MNTDFFIDNHRKSIAALIELHKRRFFSDLAVEAPPSSHQIDQRHALVVADGQRYLTGGMHGHRIDRFFVNFDGFEQHEGVGVVDGDGAIGVGREEVPREGGEGRRGVEGDGCDGGGVVEGSYLGRGGEVVDFDAVVVAA